MNKNGYILYQGPSVLDGVEIVVVATGFDTKSQNSKTGDMIQTTILLAEVSPIKASQTGQDVSICGDCPHRGVVTDTGLKSRTCYVNLGHGPRGIHACFKRGNYAPFPYGTGLLEGRKVRFGTYGDPAAVPIEVWDKVSAECLSNTGYTHQWQKHPEYLKYCMASVDSEEQALQVQALGRRYFRVVTDTNDPVIGKEVTCPASAEAGKKVNCDTCMACSGGIDRESSIRINIHGAFASTNNINNLIARVA